MAQFDSRTLRNVFGQFATGVCVVTMMDKDNHFHGLTISSFNTVSLEPPLVLWSLRKQSWYAQHFLKTEAFAINVLSGHQHQVSDIFASAGSDKFHRVDHRVSSYKLPLIDGALAHLECKMWRQVDGGDHWIFIGEVVDSLHTEGEPLIFFNGRYATTAGLSIPA
ncbi:MULTISPECIES: flavin reductase family protein [Enterobacter]|uniref:flavin reductase family protein n=1 Tax=Enterobacter TaxID=547 RepID=UPI000472AD72|nr:MULTISPECIES: flavin reductase family protein [Enterobacter]MCX4182209.1 flavin reductase [Enterobacter sp. HSTU-ASh6]MEB5960075.1 flavin reductase family protein [Enterobacter sichuanensis]RTN96621.1 flavin reductase [Enterobacter sp. WCHEn090032]